MRRHTPIRTLTGPDSISSESCRKLWLAALEGAAQDVRLSATTKPSHRRYGYNRPSLEREREWFYSDAEHVGSFRWVCQILNFSPSYWRRGLLSGVRTSERQREEQRRVDRNRGRRLARKVV